MRFLERPATRLHGAGRTLDASSHRHVVVNSISVASAGHSYEFVGAGPNPSVNRRDRVEGSTTEGACGTIAHASVRLPGTCRPLRSPTRPRPSATGWPARCRPRAAAARRGPRGRGHRRRRVHRAVDGDPPGRDGLIAADRPARAAFIGFSKRPERRVLRGQPDPRPGQRERHHPGEVELRAARAENLRELVDFTGEQDRLRSRGDRHPRSPTGPTRSPSSGPGSRRRTSGAIGSSSSTGRPSGRRSTRRSGRPASWPGRSTT